MEKRFDFSSRMSCLPRDKSGKELRFDECPSCGRGLRFFAETPISLGSRYSRNADNTGRNKNYTLISVSHDPPQARPTTTTSRRRLSKPPLRRNVASHRERSKGSIMRTVYQMSRGLPRSDTVTKVVIV